jgi:transposase InsO family protein
LDGNGQHFYLYVLIDIFSRYVVGLLVAHAENAGLALIEGPMKHGGA